ncbi:MAG: hypothetical protein ACKVOU_05955 [Cytophagales bacterium]
MTNVLIIIFSMTLIYLLAAGRLKTYATALAVQGVILFAIAFNELHGLREENYVNLVFILIETIIFKGIVVPLYLNYLIKKNKLYYEREPDETNFFALFKIGLIFILSLYLGYALHNGNFQIGEAYRLSENTFKITYFTASISAVFTGILMLTRRKKIITLIVGYLVLENGLFMLSLALGNEMPIVVNLGILFDIFTTVFLLGIFLTRVKNVFEDLDISKLTELKD